MAQQRQCSDVCLQEQRHHQVQPHCLHAELGARHVRGWPLMEHQRDLHSEQCEQRLRVQGATVLPGKATGQQPHWRYDHHLCASRTVH